MDGEKKKLKFSLGYLIVAFWAVLLLQQVFSAYLQPTRTSYSDFKAAVASGKVAEVSIGHTVIRGHMKGEPEAEAKGTVGPTEGQPAPKQTPPAHGSTFETVRVDDADLMRDLSAHGVKVTGVVETSFWHDAAGWLIPLVILGVLWVVVLRRVGQVGQNGFLAVGRSKAKVYMEKDVHVRFSDVAGVDEAKEELREVIDFLKTPARFGRLGAKLPKGVLLVGPPGTGKTLLARAVAGEAGVPFFSISGSDFVEMFVGVGAARVRDLFEQAKQKAPCIVFVDELDALGKARGIGPVTHEEREQTLNQLLVELDGFDARVGVILMAATNRPEILDPALLRAGRFDRHVLVDRPGRADRLRSSGCTPARSPWTRRRIWRSIAAMTAGFVGADLANIVNEAALLGVRRDCDRVGMAELQEAVERIVAGLEKKNRVLSPAEKKRVAHHELGHALVALSLPRRRRRSQDLHHPARHRRARVHHAGPDGGPVPDDRERAGRKVATLLGGRAAEELIYDEVSTGAHDDLGKATDIARSMVKTFGMSPRVGQVSFEKDRRGLMLQSPTDVQLHGEYSDQTARAIDDEVRRIIDEQRDRATEILSQRHEVLLRAAQVLLAKETISGQELRDLLAASEPSEPATEPLASDVHAI